MNNKFKYHYLWLLLVLLLSGCSIFEDEDEEEELEYAELPDIEQLFDVDILWDDSLGDGVDIFYSRLTPALSDERLYVANRAGEVGAYELTTGKELWEINLHRGGGKSLLSKMNPFSYFDWIDEESALLSGGILAAYGNLYIGSEHGELIALNSKTGEEIWRTPTKGEVIAKPGYGDGLVYINTGAGVVEAFHPDTGENRWYYEQEVPTLTLRGNSAPTVATGGVLFGTANGKLTTLTSDNGVEIWQQSIGTAQGATELARLVDVDPQPIVSGANAYAIGLNGNLIAVELRSGRQLWKREYSSFQNLTIEGTNLYVIDDKDQLFAIDNRNGTERWSQVDLFRRGLTAPVVYKNFIVVGDKLGYLLFFDKDNGKLLAYEDFDSSGFYTAPVVSEDHLIVQTRDGEVSVLTIP